MNSLVRSQELAAVRTRPNLPSRLSSLAKFAIPQKKINLRNYDPQVSFSGTEQNHLLFNQVIFELPPKTNCTFLFFCN
jgi:hypothetical protein